LFVAVELPDAVRERVEHGVQPLRERYPSGRWVPIGDQHVTMKFLGATWPRLLDGVVACVGDVASRHRPFETRVATLGAFPSPRRARVLWVGLEDPARRLGRLAADLDDTLAGTFARDARAFTPHLTIARFDPPIALEADLAELGVESSPFDVAWLTLFRSHLGRRASRYEPMATFPLAGTPGR
jgi:2'-5' RNA ligase